MLVMLSNMNQSCSVSCRVGGQVAPSPATHRLPWASFTHRSSPRQTVCLPRHHQNDTRRGQVAVHGILDSYRKSQGATVSADDDDPIDKPAAASSMDGADADSPCPVECVQQIYTVKEYDDAIQNASTETLVVIDFYRTACGSCKYIQPGFLKLCKGSTEKHEPVVFLKHNVMDEYDEETDLAHKLKIKNVPLFCFYKGGELVEQFATRERRRIAQAINKHVGHEVLSPN
ncbi:hypothetical protein WJX72_010705 [[Myrmecia] bisecta]|uniref:Thioredoxin domain-containing protein n=1 Tax=[Myrmecia] bisecta TaxID=41462 RepID=A0AAW1PC70_9CHLO